MTQDNFDGAMEQLLYRQSGEAARSVATWITKGMDHEALTSTEAASRLRLSEQAVVRSEQDLPARRVGGEWRF